ncbi:MAG: hypothetical protein U1C70_14110 [Sediminibacterium sp.]|jgi:hypothetical protein|uniref:hypothetical protein n=1 Tax=Sediminibacterium sp. TaxID=1917865 RepID=UPI002AB82BDA|nr:hypothetical protein [Sediminibacterium sp.]MDZ4072952.1 hypothetical protein [Sediminibacterium sp.]
MQDTFRELNVLIHEGTQQDITETVREQKRKEATLKARELEKYFTGAFMMVQCKKTLRSLIIVTVKILHIWLEKLYRTRPSEQKRNRTHEQLELWCTDTLHFVRRHFQEHFNPNEPMPHCLWDPIKEQQDTYWESLSADITEHSTSTSLIALLRTLYQSQLQATGTHSYYHAEYWTELLSILPSEQPGLYEDPTTAMIFTLIRRNCNHGLFIHFFIERCTLLQSESTQALQHWAKYLHWVDRIPLIDQMGIEPSQPSVKDQLKEAIQKELIRCQQEAQNESQQNSLPEGALFHTTLSVSQLAALFRLLVEAEILVTNNNKELMRRVSQTFRTNRTKEPISAHHLYDKFYTLELPALSILRTHITNLLQKIAKLSH